MTFAFGLLTAGTVLMLSGYFNEPVQKILSGTFTHGNAADVAFESSLAQEVEEEKTSGNAGAGNKGGANAGNLGNNASVQNSLKKLSTSNAQALARGLAEATKISGKYPYSWAGGHSKLGVPGGQEENGGPGFDCSGAVSAVLGAMGLITAPMDSTALMSFGEPGAGKGTCVIYANTVHTFMKIGGLWFGTGNEAKNGKNTGGPAFGNHDPDTSGFVVRHPKGF